VVAFIVSLLLTVAMVAPIFPYAKRRPVGTPLTWGEAMLGATYVFFIIFWIYGVVPHQFLTWADSELNWRPDVVWLGPGGQFTLPFDIASLDIFPQAYNAGQPVFRGLHEDNDPSKPLRMFVNYNTDISQFWEWSSRGLRPIGDTNEAYKLGVNSLLYGLMH